MSYVDGFIVAVPEKNLAKYRKVARACGKVWKEHGALTYVECVGDDTPHGTLTSFPRAVKLEEGEVVVFSWITYRSRRHRDAVNARVMADPRMKALMDPATMVFDGKRLIYGGFRTMIAL